MLRLTPRGLVVVGLGLAAADIGTKLARGSTIPGGALDETAHALTTVLVFWALGSRLTEGYAGPALIASAAIDLDHVPHLLGADWLTAGTPRPYTHSLTTVAAVLTGAWLWREQRRLLMGTAAGLAIHFWRDLGDRVGVPLLWPVSSRRFRLPHSLYLLSMLFVIGVDGYRCGAWPATAKRGSSRPTAAGSRAAA